MSDKNTEASTLSIDPSLGEAISALTDNEANDLDLQRILGRTTNNSDDLDDAVRDKWQRYNLSGALLRGEVGVVPSVGFAASVMNAIDAEPNIAELSQSEGRSSAAASLGSSPLRKWRDGFGKVAIAATVAFGCLFGVQQYNLSGDSQATGVAAQVANGDSAISEPLKDSSVIPMRFTQQLNARTVGTGSNVSGLSLPLTGAVQAVPERSAAVVGGAVEPELQARFDRLLHIHAENTAKASDLGVLSFARLSELRAEQAKVEAGATEIVAEEVDGSMVAPSTVKDSVAPAANPVQP